MLFCAGRGGLGADPLDEAQLRFVYEDGLQPLPSMAITLTYPPLLAAYAAAGADPARVLHGEQQFRLHGPLPVDAELEGRTRVLGLVDKGPGRGLLVYNRTEVPTAGATVRSPRSPRAASCSTPAARAATPWRRRSNCRPCRSARRTISATSRRCRRRR